MLTIDNKILTEEATAFVMPQVNSVYITRALTRGHIEFDAYRFDEIVRGTAPLGEEAVKAQLARDFPEWNSVDAACIIYSRVPHDAMLAAAKSIYEKPLSEEMQRRLKHIMTRIDDMHANTAYIVFDDKAQERVCVTDAISQAFDVVSDWVEEAEEGSTYLINAVLDPALYAHTGEDVMFRGYVWDPARGGDVEWRSNAVVVELLRTGDGVEDLGFTVSHVALDLDPEFAYETGEMADAATMFLIHTDEDSFFPVDGKLYFPRRPEGKQWMSYDDPAAAPYLDILFASGWEGQEYVTEGSDD